MKVVMCVPATDTEAEREIDFYGIPVPPVGASVVLDSAGRNRSYVVKHLVWFLADQADDPMRDHVRVVLQSVASHAAARKSTEKGCR